MKKEKKLLLSEWVEYSKADLDSAEIILKQSSNYNIVIYHCHQCIEKIFKWFLIKNDKEFPFIHDLKKLLDIINTIKDFSYLNDKIKEINEIYPALRYPSGDKILKATAEKNFNIAKEIFHIFENINK